MRLKVQLNLGQVREIMFSYLVEKGVVSSNYTFDSFSCLDYDCEEITIDVFEFEFIADLNHQALSQPEFTPTVQRLLEGG